MNSHHLVYRRFGASLSSLRVQTPLSGCSPKRVKSGDTVQVPLRYERASPTRHPPYTASLDVTGTAASPVDPRSVGLSSVPGCAAVACRRGRPPRTDLSTRSCRSRAHRSGEEPPRAASGRRAGSRRSSAIARASAQRSGLGSVARVISASAKARFCACVITEVQEATRGG